MILNFFRWRKLGIRLVLALLVVVLIAALTAGKDDYKKGKPHSLGHIQTVAFTPGCVDKPSSTYYAHLQPYGASHVLGTTKWWLRICWGPGGWITSVTSTPDNNMYTWANLAQYHIKTGVFVAGTLPYPSVRLSQYMKVGNQASDAQMRLTSSWDGPAVTGGGVKHQAYTGWGWQCTNSQCVNYGPSYSFSP